MTTNLPDQFSIAGPLRLRDTTAIPKPTLSHLETAAMLGVTDGTLRVWRCTGKGPRFTKYGSNPRGKVVYRYDDVKAWMDAQTYISTSDYSATIARVSMHIQPGAMQAPLELSNR